jgi:hypothetical protein
MIFNSLIMGGSFQKWVGQAWWSTPAVLELQRLRWKDHLRNTRPPWKHSEILSKKKKRIMILSMLEYS